MKNYFDNKQYKSTYLTDNKNCLLLYFCVKSFRPRTRSWPSLSGVNFSNILRADFCTRVFLYSSKVLTVCVCNFLTKKKSAQKLFVNCGWNWLQESARAAGWVAAAVGQSREGEEFSGSCSVQTKDQSKEGGKFNVGGWSFASKVWESNS